jgi:hypothetical protein
VRTQKNKAPDRCSGPGARALQKLDSATTIAQRPTSAQVGDGRKTAARYAGTALRKSRSIAATIQARGVVIALQGPIDRLRRALDSLAGLLDGIRGSR